MKIAFKNFLMTLKRYKVASFLNIAGLTLAFTAFYVIASQVIYSLTYNRSLKDSERIFNVAFWSKSSENWSANSPNPISYEVADIMPEVESIASMNPAKNKDTLIRLLNLSQRRKARKETIYPLRLSEKKEN